MSKKMTKEEARQLAIDWQHWSSERALSYGEIAERTDYLRKLAIKYHLIREFQRNGIL